MYPGAGWAQDAGKIGVLMLHGKNPGGPQSPQYAPVKAAMEKQGWLVLLPDMPWSRNRYLQGHWDGAMAEIAQHVKTLQDKGATRIVLMGHSMGVPAAMSHAARGGTAHALVLLAPHPALALLGFGLIGVGTSAMFPLAMSAAAQRTDRAPATNVAALAQISFVAFLLGPPLLGYVAEHFGIRWSFGITLPLVALAWWACTALVPRRAG